jgi:hypothetical protein
MHPLHIGSDILIGARPGKRHHRGSCFKGRRKTLFFGAKQQLIDTKRFIRGSPDTSDMLTHLG